MEASEKKMGMAIVVNKEGVMQGILTDGDIRRALVKFSDPRSIALTEVMTVSPKRAEPEELAVAALRRMEEHQITALILCTPNGKPVGAVHMHDILKAGIS